MQTTGNVIIKMSSALIASIKINVIKCQWWWHRFRFDLNMFLTPFLGSRSIKELAWSWIV